MKSHRTLNVSRKSWYLELIDDSGRPRYDISPLWANHEAFSALVHDIEEHFQGIEYDQVVALDALGLFLGAAIASSSGKDLVPVRKGGKLPLSEDRLMSIEFQDYDQKRKIFEVVKDLLSSGEHIVTIRNARSDKRIFDSRNSSIVSERTDRNWSTDKSNPSDNGTVGSDRCGYCCSLHRYKALKSRTHKG